MVDREPSSCATDPGGSRELSNPEIIAFLAIIAVAAILRFYQLGTRSLWVDEILETVRLEAGPTGVKDANAFDLHPPLRLWLNGLPYWICGGASQGPATELQLRLVPAILGLASVALMLPFLRRFMGVDSALLGAALLAVNRSHIEYSQDGRMYSAVVFFTLITLIATAKAADVIAADLPRTMGKPLVGWSLATLTNLCTSYFAVPVFLAESLYLCGVLARRASWHRARLPLLLAVAAVLITAPFWTWNAIEISNAKGISLGLADASQLEWLLHETALEWFSGPLASFPAARLSIIVNLIALAIGGCITLRRAPGWAALFASLFGLPLLCLVLVKTQSSIVPRYFLFLLPAVIALQAKAMDGLSERGGRSGPKVALASLLLLAGLPGLLSFYTAPKQNWKAAAGILVSHLPRDQEAVILVGPVASDTCLIYYLRRQGFVIERDTRKKNGTYRYNSALARRGPLRLRILPPDVEFPRFMELLRKAGGGFYIGSFPGMGDQMPTPAVDWSLRSMRPVRRLPGTYRWGEIEILENPAKAPPQR